MIDLGLRKVLESGHGILFLGAGIGFCATDKDGNHMPTGAQLAAELASHFKIDLNGPPDLATVSQVVEIRRGRAELHAFLSKRLSGYEPDESLKWLLGLTWRAIFTTNYDRVIQRTYELNPKPTQTPVTIASTSTLQHVDPRLQVPIYHIHGALFDISPPHVLITEQDYSQFRERRKMLFEILKHEMATSTLIYVGYSHNDPNWKVILSELRSEFNPSPLPHAYRVTPVTDPLEREILTAQGITTVDMTLGDFATEAAAILGELRVNPRDLSTIRGAVPSALHEAFDSNPASTLRLLQSWTYVNQEDFHAAANVPAFLQGDRPNWALVGQKQHFERDIEEEILEHLLDYATAAKASRPLYLVLGSAGYGITTLLMSLSASLTRESAGPVFAHRSGTPLSLGDIEFAATIFKSSRPYFVIDDAADYVAEISGAVVRTASMRVPACFLLGERVNEWRQLPRSIKATEFALKSLSEVEIPKLLAFLEEHNSLGQLAPLVQELRIAAVREKHDRQLLVAMREATEGKIFDAIIEDEYRNIKNPLARHIYAIVSCSYQLRCYLRDSVLASMIGLSVTEMYDQTKDATQGVIDFECLDSANGVYAARCRHHSIAEIVWARCVSLADRQEILPKIMESVNLMKHADADLFEALVRSDQNIDSMGSLDIKMRFFEGACRKNPRSAYVRQHYARMLMREHKTELALAQINSAIAMAPDLRILYHTKGVALMNMALEVPGLEIARRRLIQSEAAFREALRQDPRDAYAYQGLADLYLRWAKRVPDEQEQSDYIDKAETTISEGLRTVRQRESLYITSAQIQSWLGNTPKALDRLKRASTSPIAKYLIARTHFQQKEYKETLAVLLPLIKTNPSDPRITMLYATALVADGHPYADAIAALRLSNLLGIRDARYVAMLGGMNFVDGKLSFAQAVFDQARKQQFPVEDELRPFYFPHVLGNPNVPLRLDGTVASVRAGYIFLGSPGFPNVFCPSFRIGKTILKNGMGVSFQLVFNAKGAIAQQLHLI